MEALKKELREKIVSTLDLVDVAPDDIGDDDQLVGGAFGIDSIDVLELVIMLEEDYGVTIDSKEVGEKVFRSLATLSQYVHDNRG